MANRAGPHIEESFESIDVFITTEEDDDSLSSWQVINPSDDYEIYSLDESTDGDHHHHVPRDESDVEDMMTTTMI